MSNPWGTTMTEPKVTQDDRESFEAWYLDHLMIVQDVEEADARVYLKRDKQDNYVHGHTHISWTAYFEGLQRSRTQATEAVGYKLVPIVATDEIKRAIFTNLVNADNEGEFWTALLSVVSPVATERNRSEGEAVATFTQSKTPLNIITLTDAGRKWAEGKVGSFNLYASPPLTQQRLEALEGAEIGLANLLSYQSAKDKPNIHEYGQASRALHAIRALIEQGGN